MKCQKCDKEANANYNGLCEDCWVDSSTVAGNASLSDVTIRGSKRRIDPRNGDVEFAHFKQALKNQ